MFLTEMLPGRRCKQAAGHRDRTAGRGALDHLRHLGTVRARAAVPANTYSPRSSRCFAISGSWGRFFARSRLNGIGVFTAGMVLALMVIPFIASVMRDVFETVPPVLKESAYGIGCTTWEVVLQHRAALHEASA
jgi:hypothetical protein